jgi:hypothetical protein
MALTITYSIFLLAMLFVIISLPFLIILIALIIYKKKIGISFKISGFYQLSDFIFVLEDEKIKLEIWIEKIQIKLVWMRIRLLISGFKCGSFIKYTSPEPEISLNSSTRETLTKSKIPHATKKAEKILEDIKNKFWSISNKQLSKRVKNLYDTHGEALKSLDDLLEQSMSGYRISDLVRKILQFVDIEVNDIQAKIQFELTKDCIHLVSVGKILIGVVKDETKVFKINF